MTPDYSVPLEEMDGAVALGCLRLVLRLLQGEQGLVDSKPFLPCFRDGIDFSPFRLANGMYEL